MDKVLEFLTKLLEVFKGNPAKTIILVIVLVGGAVWGLYLYTHQAKTPSEGSQSIQSTGDNNTNLNSK